MSWNWWFIVCLINCFKALILDFNFKLNFNKSFDKKVIIIRHLTLYGIRKIVLIKNYKILVLLFYAFFPLVTKINDDDDEL